MNKPFAALPAVFVLVLSHIAGAVPVSAQVLEPGGKPKAEAQEAQPQAETVDATQSVIFEKPVSPQQQLKVMRKRVPRIVDPVVEAGLQEWLKTQPPGTKIIAPKYAYLYSFVLFTAEEKGKAEVERLLWTFRQEEFGVHPKFLDAVVGENTLAYIYDESGNAIANVVRLGRDTSEIGFAASGLDIEHPGNLSDDDRITSATFKGSLKEHTLVVEATNAAGLTTHFELEAKDGKDTWKRLPDPQPEPKDVNPAPPDQLNPDHPKQ